MTRRILWVSLLSAAWLGVLAVAAFANTTVYSGGNVEAILNPSASGEHILSTGGATLGYKIGSVKFKLPTTDGTAGQLIKTDGLGVLSFVSQSVDAPANAGYWVDTANGTLTAERNLGALTTGLVLNTVTAGVGVPSAYGGALCTNQFPRSLNANGAATCASVSLTADVIGNLPYANLTQATAASKILVRGSAAGGGDWQEGSLGPGLTMSGTTLSASGTITAVANTVATSETTASTTYTDLTTSGPAATVTIGPSGILIVGLRGQVINQLSGYLSHISFALSGGNTRAVADDVSIAFKTANASDPPRFGAVHLFTGLAASSTTITAKYKVNGGTGEFGDRHLWVMTW